LETFDGLSFHLIWFLLANSTTYFGLFGFGLFGFGLFGFGLFGFGLFGFGLFGFDLI
jgi:hypothetical protein